MKKTFRYLQLSRMGCYVQISSKKSSALADSVSLHHHLIFYTQYLAHFRHGKIATDLTELSTAAMFEIEI